MSAILDIFTREPKLFRAKKRLRQERLAAIEYLDKLIHKAVPLTEDWVLKMRMLDWRESDENVRHVKAMKYLRHIHRIKRIQGEAVARRERILQLI